jgi:uncharacterized protein YcbX
VVTTEQDPPAARLAVLTVYPVKSARGTAVTEAVVEPWGLAGDRRWAVVAAADGARVGAARCPALMTLDASPAPDGGLLLAAPGAGALRVPPPSPAAVPVPVRDFTGVDRAVPVSAAADAWLSAVLGRPVRLVWQDDPARRPVAPGHGGLPGDVFSLADTAPLLLTTTASLRRLDEWTGPGVPPLDMRRFRPNAVVANDGDEPFAEDRWTRVRIGGVTFRLTERCDRCSVTLRDPDTLAGGPEPIRSLARHRRGADGKVYFGVRLVPETTGPVRVGDPVRPVPAPAAGG